METMPEYRPIPGVEIRYTELSDARALKTWLLDPTVARWFPMYDEVEIDDAVNRWIYFYKYKCSLTAVLEDGTPCGLITLYLQPYRKLAHQSEFGIIVAPDHRNKGIGSQMLHHLIHLSKTNFNIELLHLQVYQDNPATHLYTRFGFREFGRQTHWIKETDGTYVARVFMEKFI